MYFVKNHFNLAQNPPFRGQGRYDKYMNQTALPVYETAEALLAAETTLAAEAAEKASN